MKGTSLYFIKDVCSGVPESTIIQVANDIVAIKGFIEFCKNDKVVASQHKLYKLCSLDDDNNIIPETVYPDGKPQFVCRGDTAEETFNELINNIKDED